MDAARFCTIAAVVVAAYLSRNDLPPLYLGDAVAIIAIGLFLLWMNRKRSVSGNDTTDN